MRDDDRMTAKWTRNPNRESFAWAGHLRLFVFPPMVQASQLYRPEREGKWEWLVQDRGLHGYADSERGARLEAAVAASEVLSEGVRDCADLIRWAKEGTCAPTEE